ncbi:mechanosensitive ion channel family protein [Photobacterium nomapromontoriensis]|uniref:mechanosensitive ion channel family protein n=1 Tax=Photobacterium nomapromontoriensis TaxID=2910237 RepID=UPI003D139E17
MRWLLFIGLLFIELLGSTMTFAEQETVNTPNNFDKIEQYEQELGELYRESLEQTGTAKNILDMQMLKKNESIRDELAKLISDRTADTTPTIIKFVKGQVKYLNQADDFLSNSITKQQQKFDQSNQEQKLILQKSMHETTRFYHRILNEQWTNYQWLNQLGVPDKKQEAELVNTIKHRLDFVSATLSFNSQQESMLAKQSKSAAEGEKSSLQLQLILLQRQVSSDIDGLQSLVDLANKMNIDTTDYTRQLFESTGNLTNELLNFKVIVSILSTWMTEVRDWLLDNTPQALFKIFIFLLIVFIFKLLKNITRRVISKAVSSPTLRMSQLMKDFFISISGNAVFAVGLLIALSQIGLDLTPILTGFGVAGVIIGFALQDTLSNFASGMMLLIYRPFDVDDFVEAGGTSGKVSHMSLVSTTIKTFDNQILIVPNSKIWGDTIKNITHERVRRVDMVFGIGYSDDVEKTERVLHDIITEHPMVLRSPEATIKLHTLNTSSVDFIVRPWVKTEDYWDVYWDITREVKMRFDREGISIPFPQQDVHIHTVNNEK